MIDPGIFFAPLVKCILPNAWMNVNKSIDSGRIAPIRACRFVGEEHQQRRVCSTYLNKGEKYIYEKHI